jgi:hypothetical protein
VILLVAACVLAAGGAGAVVLLSSRDDSGVSDAERQRAAALTCSVFAEQSLTARRNVIANARGRSDSTLVLVDDVCEQSPSFTIGRAIAYGIGAPPPHPPKISDGLAPRVPAGAVVVVGDNAITSGEYERWLRVARTSSTPGYDPRDSNACVAAKRARSSSASDDTLARRCQVEADGLRDQVLQFLILERWVTGEAAADGLTPSTALYERAFVKAKHDTFPADKDFQKFLSQSSMTVSDARFQVNFNTLYADLRTKALFGVRRVSDAKLRAQREKQADDAFNASLRKRWKAVTLCAPGYVMDQCSNSRTTTTTTPG